MDEIVIGLVSGLTTAKVKQMEVELHNTYKLFFVDSTCICIQTVPSVWVCSIFIKKTHIFNVSTCRLELNTAPWWNTREMSKPLLNNERFNLKFSSSVYIASRKLEKKNHFVTFQKYQTKCMMK